MKALNQEFNEEEEGFTNRDYVLQLCVNGQWSALTEFLQGLEGQALTELIWLYPKDLKTVGLGRVRRAIEKRMVEQKCRVINNEQLSRLYEVEKWLHLVETMEGSSRNAEALETLSQTIRELDPSSEENENETD
tara:strand:- start:1046 stop:1447 length:402 start_codon:yes stop_codon:yes gene_type:complete